MLPGQPGYDEARRIHNGMIDKHPAMIVRCAGVADVISAVRFARKEGIVASVRGTGHNVAGFSLCDDGLVIDLSAMKGIHANPAARTARVEPGVTWGELNHELQAFDLAATGGFVGTTGVGASPWGGSGLDGPQTRLRSGQPALRRCGHRRRRISPGQCDRAFGFILGDSRRRRKFRYRHVLRVSGATLRGPCWRGLCCIRCPRAGKQCASGASTRRPRRRI